MFVAFFLTIAAFFQTSAEIPKGLRSFLNNYQSHRVTRSERPDLYNHFYSNSARAEKAVVIVPGMGEPSIKYYELAQDLQVPNTKLYFWDHIGQGFSSHLLPKEVEKVHVSSFEDYTHTLTDFLKKLKTQHKEVAVISHSMGGHISLKVAYENPNLIDRLVMSAPMIDFHTTLYPVHYLNFLLYFLPSSMYPPLSFIYRQQSRNRAVLTHSMSRIINYEKIRDHFPSLRRESVTVGWLYNAVNSIRELKSHFKQKLTSKVLLLEAGEEYLVSRLDQSRFCLAREHCRHVVFPESRHEILYEKEEIRGKALAEIVSFLKSKI